MGSLGLNWQGFYRLKAELQTAELQTTRRKLFCRVQGFLDSVLGLHAHEAVDDLAAFEDQ